MVLAIPFRRHGHFRLTTLEEHHEARCGPKDAEGAK
jgi:hypothetical protein